MRVADHLYWTGRYIKRAENTVKAVEGAYHTSLLRKDHAPEEWNNLLFMLGQRDHYLGLHAEFALDRLLHFMILDCANPASLFSLIKSARENGRSTWGTISLDAWESLNSIWLDLNGWQRKKMDSAGDLVPLLTQIGEGVQRFSGVLHNDLLHDDAFRIIGLGNALEKSDYLIRVVTSRFGAMTREPSKEKACSDALALLRWIGATEIYQKIFRNVVSPRFVLELLVTRTDVRCSLYSSIERMNRSLEPFSSGNGNRAAQMATRLMIRTLEFRNDDLMRDSFLKRLRALADELDKLAGQINAWFQGAACA